jgi:hypothetical protein
MRNGREAVMKSDFLMMWFDTKGLPEERIQRGIKYFREKYGQDPNLVLVSPFETIRATAVREVQVKPVGSVIRNHYWLGREG